MVGIDARRSIEQVARPCRSEIDPVDRAEKIHLSNVDAVMAKDGAGHRDMKVRVGYHHLQKIVLSEEDFARRGSRNRYMLGRGGYVLLPPDAVDEGQCLLNSRPHFLDCAFTRHPPRPRSGVPLPVID